MISLILPAYNEAKRIEKSVNVVVNELKKCGDKFEVVIAEDGARDGTDKIAERLAKKYNYVKHFHSDKRLGRGLALTEAFRKSGGDILAYVDVDMATNPKHIPELINEIEMGADVSTGSRYLKGSITKRKQKRLILSMVYNFLVRMLLNSKIKDHQCGFKSFRRKSVLSLLKNVENNHWFWDTEVLVRAQKMGLKVTEIPVKWYQRGNETKVDVVKDSLNMFFYIIRLMLKLKGE